MCGDDGVCVRDGVPGYECERVGAERAELVSVWFFWWRGSNEIRSRSELRGVEVPHRIRKVV